MTLSANSLVTRLAHAAKLVPGSTSSAWCHNPQLDRDADEFVKMSQYRNPIIRCPRESKSHV